MAALGRVWLVDDNAEFRGSAAWWLDGLGYEVRQLDGPGACLAAAAEAGDGPGCLLLDIRMPEMSGLQLLDALRERQVRWPVIFMTGHGDVPLAVEAMRKGALTFLEKPFQEDALEEALGQAFGAGGPASAETSGAPPVAREIQPELQGRIDALTPREREVMDLVVEGHPNKVVAFKLGISPKTVELHRSRVMAKMGARSLTQLVRMTLSGRTDGVV